MRRSQTIFMISGALALAACQTDKANAKPSEAKPAKAAAKKAAAKMDLMKPETLSAKAPEKFTVKLETTKGDILIDVTRAWAPNGADRFFNLVKAGYYNATAFFRVIPGFMAQIGIHGKPEVAAKWRVSTIKDDAVKESNSRGTVTFATAGPNSRTTQIFFNFGNNARLDGMGFAPFGKVRDMKTVDALNGEYGEGQPRGRGPAQGKLQMEGNSYLKASYPRLDYIKSASVVKG